MNLFYGNCSVLSFRDIIEKLFILLQMNKYSDIITLCGMGVIWLGLLWWMSVKLKPLTAKCLSKKVSLTI